MSLISQMEIDQPRQEELHRSLQSPERCQYGPGELETEVSGSSSRFVVGFLCTELLLFPCSPVGAVVLMSSGDWIMR